MLCARHPNGATWICTGEIQAAWYNTGLTGGGVGVRIQPKLPRLVPPPPSPVLPQACPPTAPKISISSAHHLHQASHSMLAVLSWRKLTLPVNLVLLGWHTSFHWPTQVTSCCECALWHVHDIRRLVLAEECFRIAF